MQLHSRKGDSMNIGSRLKEVLEEKDITVSRLAREAEVPAQTIYALIKRDSNKVDMEILFKILNFLDLSLAGFLGQEPECRMEAGAAETVNAAGSFIPDQTKTGIPPAQSIMAGVDQGYERLKEIAALYGIEEEAVIMEVLTEFLESGFTGRLHTFEEIIKRRSPRHAGRRQEIDDYLL